MICNDWKEFFDEFKKILFGEKVNCMYTTAEGVKMSILPETKLAHVNQELSNMNITINARDMDLGREDLVEAFRKLDFEYFDEKDGFSCYQRWYNLDKGNAKDLAQLIGDAHALLGVTVPPIDVELAYFPRTMTTMFFKNFL